MQIIPSSLLSQTQGCHSISSSLLIHLMVLLPMLLRFLSRLFAASVLKVCLLIAFGKMFLHLGLSSVNFLVVLIAILLFLVYSLISIDQLFACHPCNHLFLLLCSHLFLLLFFIQLHHNLFLLVEVFLVINPIRFLLYGNILFLIADGW